jgi:uncharacterized protein
MATPEPAPVVRVLYALPDEQIIVEVPHEAGMTAALAVERSGLIGRYPALGRAPLVLGIWGIETDAAHPVRAGDRVEISRPLVADPRDMRRELMTGGRVMGGAALAIRKKDRV